MLETAHFQVRRLTSLVNDMLDMSRISAGKLKLNLAIVDLSKLLREIVGHFKEDFRAAQCEVALSADAPVTGYWDRATLEQVVINLVTNAMKYGDCKPIEISVEEDADIARLIVADHGIGIPKEFQSQLFHRFERADSAKTFQGTGLGLWICRQIVEAHRGSIRVVSEEGHGSKFIVELPKK
jgi:signal transduction histidine kinase